MPMKRVPREEYRSRSFPASYEQSEAVMLAIEKRKMSWSEIQEVVTRLSFLGDYGVAWPEMRRQIPHVMVDRELRRTKRGKFVVYGHVISPEQESMLQELAWSRGMPRGWYTAFLELAMRKYFQQVTGIEWPPKKRLGESYMEPPIRPEEKAS